MRQIIYQSVSTGPKAAAIAPDILRGARPFNGMNGVTGLLLATGDRFMQVLEGPEDSVEVAMDRIRADSRHRDVEVLTDGPTDARAFPDWSMAYRDEGHPAGLLEERMNLLLARTPPDIASYFRRFALS